MELFLEIENEFKDDYNRLLKGSKYSLDSIIESALESVSEKIGGSRISSPHILDKLISDLYDSRKSRKRRLIMNAYEEFNELSIKDEIEAWDDHPTELYLVRFPFAKVSASEFVTANNLESDMLLFSYLKLRKSALAMHEPVLVIPDVVHGMTSASPKTKIAPSKVSAVSIQSSTVLTEYPSIENLLASIGESDVDAGLSIYKPFSEYDLRVLGFVCNKLVIGMLENQLVASFDIRELVMSMYGEYRGKYEDEVITSLIKLTSITFMRDGLIMRMLSNYSLTEDQDSRLMVRTTLDSFLAEQIRGKQIMRLDESIYRTIKHDMGQALILPFQAHRIKNYLKEGRVEIPPIRIDWQWLQINLSIALGLRPSTTLKRVEVALGEMIEKGVIIKAYNPSGGALHVEFVDISSDEMEFIKDNYESSKSFIRNPLDIFS